MARARGLARLLALGTGVLVAAPGAWQLGPSLARLAATHAFSLLVLGAALSFTTGGVFMKASEGMTRPGPTVLLLACFALGACLQTLAMRGQELGVTYIVVLGVEAIVACWLGWLVYGEPLTPFKLGGIVAILVGIVALRA